MWIGAEAIALIRQRGAESMPATPRLLLAQCPGHQASTWPNKGKTGKLRTNCVPSGLHFRELKPEDVHHSGQSSTVGVLSGRL